MKIIPLLILLLAAALSGPAPLRAAGEEDALAQDRSEELLGAMDCSAKKARLFSDYLSGRTPVNGSLKFRCAKGKETIPTPAWLPAELSSMTVNQLETGKEKTTEAQLWQEPLAALYDFAAMVRKTAPVKGGGLGVPPKFLQADCQELLTRLDRAVAALRRARLAGSFGGRGDLVFTGFVRALADLDALERSYDIGSQVTYYERAAGVLKNAEDAFSALFTEAPAELPAGGRFSAEYYVAPRLLEGQRAVSLAFPAYKLEGLTRGDRVDLMVTYENATAAGRETIEATIIQAAPVLSVSKAADASSGQGSVRLMLSPVQAQYAALAVLQGKGLDLAVRAAGDTELRALDAANFKKIIK